MRREPCSPKISSTSEILFGLCSSVDNAPPLEILRQVDVTVDNLAKNERYFSGVVRMCLPIIESVKECPADCLLDESEFCIGVLEKAESDLRSVYANMETRIAAAQADPELFGDHEESVVDQYRLTMRAVEELHDCFRDLRWAIMEHNASVEDSDYMGHGDVEDVITALRA